MTRETAHQIYSRLLRQQFEHSESDDTTKLADCHYQQEGKADRDNYNAIITLIAGFILMLLVSLIACIFFPAPSTQDYTSTSTWDVTPVITPVQVMMGFN
ncbi:hypothetical protein [Mastigocladopsis repens]|uniref:hypothetical protein n=1 Tax=Mastigocladopsis repens TaxID=221287 RepID=UPI00030C1906|nr:hypothetical protein [Mastigocladopsis repens]